MALLAFLSLAFTVLPVAFIIASPIPGLDIHIEHIGAAITTPTRLSINIVDSRFVRPALFARAVYCPPEQIQNLSCGPNCDAINGVTVVHADGDDGSTPFFYVAFDPSTTSVVVAHEGTDPSNALSVLNDLEFAQVSLDSSAIPNAPDGVKVHDGFQKAFLRSADTILSSVQTVLSDNGASKVLVTGHSLGAAIATMDAMMLRQKLDPSIQIDTVVFGLPRGGNKPWANFVDSALGSSFVHITNQRDPVPLLPPRALFFEQPAGEIHIHAVNAQGQATDIVSCAGHDNINCANGNTIMDPSVPDHLGPYFDDIILGGCH